MSIKVNIVGGGLGGFSAGAYLSRKGYEVELFDKNKIPGGYCQAFKRNNVLIHPAVLRVTCTELVEDYCRQAGIEKIEWNSYPEYYQFGHDMKVNQCLDNIDEQLIQYFKEDEENIKRFFSDIRDLHCLMDRVFGEKISLKNLSIEESKRYLAAVNKTAGELIQEYFGGNKILGDMILAMLELDDKSVALTIPVAFAEVKGRGEYVVPKGGIFSIINKLRKIILDNGGKVHNDSAVSQIVIEGGKAAGVIIDKTFYPSDIVISGIDINKTYIELIGEEYIENKKILSDLADKWQISNSCFSVWLGFDYTLKELEIESGSFVYYPDEKNISEIRKIMNQSNGYLPEKFWFQIFTAFSDDECSTPKEKSQISLGMLLPYQFEDGWGSEGNYRVVKRKIEQMMINAFEEIYPQARGKYSFIDSASPITYEKECGNRNGAYLGYDKFPNFVYDNKRHLNQGLVDNVFFSSHWVSIIGGVFGVFQEGIKTANLIMKKYPIEGENMDEYILNREYA